MVADLIFLDVETTGLSAEDHQIVEVGCLRYRHRRRVDSYHQYIRATVKMSVGAQEVHGITESFLADKPLFAEVMDSLIQYIDGGQLVIHNAPFDMGFLRVELARAGAEFDIDQNCTVIDTLAMAREMYPGQRNTLDALCARLGVDSRHREYHGALLDADLLAQVYLLMTQSQSGFDVDEYTDCDDNDDIELVSVDCAVTVSDEEMASHQAMLDKFE